MPTAIGRYRILSHLASDAVDDVYEGFDPMIERPVVVKVFRLRLADPSAKTAVRQTFYREMQRAGMLMHPGIVTLFDAGEMPGGLFMANEFFEAKSLAEMLAAGVSADLPTRVSLISQMVDALEYARDQGVTHLNLKPTNILITADYTLKVGSFCVAGVVDALVAASSLPMPPQSRYSAPERLRGEQGDERSDVYSLAQLAIDVLTRGAERGGHPDAVPAVPPPLPVHLAEQGIDAARWAAVFARALAPGVADRFDTPGAFRVELLLTLGVGEVEARLAWETSRAEGARAPGDDPSDFDTMLAPSSNRLPPAAEPAPRFADVGPDDENVAETMLGLPSEAPTHTAIRKDAGATKPGGGASPDAAQPEPPKKPKV